MKGIIASVSTDFMGSDLTISYVTIMLSPDATKELWDNFVNVDAVGIAEVQKRMVGTMLEVDFDVE